MDFIGVKSWYIVSLALEDYSVATPNFIKHMHFLTFFKFVYVKNASEVNFVYSPIVYSIFFKNIHSGGQVNLAG